MNVPQRYRLPIAIVASVGVVVVVLVAVLLAGGGGPIATPKPSTSASASTDPMSTPEGAVRAFFEAFAEARRTDDPALVEPIVTSKQSSAYLSVAGFLGGQKDKGKGSVLTVQRLENLSRQAIGRQRHGHLRLHGGRLRHRPQDGPGAGEPACFRRTR